MTKCNLQNLENYLSENVRDGTFFGAEKTKLNNMYYGQVKVAYLLNTEQLSI